MELDLLTGGSEYISASRAAKKVGYSTDYIGQLCRAGKIPGKVIERTWYVDLPALIRHKENRQLGKPKKGLASRKASDDVQARVLTLSSTPLMMRGVALSYESDDRPLLPQLSKFMLLPVCEPAIDYSLAKRTTSLALTLVILIGAGTMMERNHLATLSVSQAASVSLFDKFAGAAEFFVEAFRDLKNVALGSFEPNPVANIEPRFSVGPASSFSEAAPARQALLAESAPSPSLESIKGDLRSELLSYFESKLSGVSRVIYQSGPTFNTTVLRQEIFNSDIRPAVTRQSDSDSNRVSSLITGVTNQGVFTDPTITGGSIAGATGSFTSLSAVNATSSTLDITGNGAGLTFYGSGNHDISAAGGTLRIGANTIIGNILPLDATIDIGAVGVRFDKIYADEINANTVVGTISGGNVSAESMRINSDNITADTENSYLEFERGTINPNAMLTWDAARDQFDFNNSLIINGRLGVGSTSPYAKVGITGMVTDTETSLFAISSTTGGVSTSTHFTVLNTGNVGIGTANPQEKVHIARGAGQAVNLLFTNDDSGHTAADGSVIGKDGGDNDFTIWNYENRDIYFGTNNTEAARILANGNVGIGTSVASTSLHIAKNVSALPTTNIYQQLEISGASNPTHRLSLGVLTSALGSATAGTGVIQALTNADNFKNLALNPSGGSVGIGTTTPNYGATTGHALTLATHSTGDPTVFEIIGDTGTQDFAFGKIDAYNGLGGQKIPSSRISFLRGDSGNDSGQIAFSTVNTNGAAIIERMRIANSGLVGIGTSTPAKTLDIYNASAARVRVDGPAGTEPGIEWGNTSVTKWLAYRPASTNDLRFYDAGGVGDAVTFKTGGNVGIGVTAPSEKLVVSDGTDSLSLGPLGIGGFVGLARGNADVGTSNYFIAQDGSSTLINSNAGSVGFRIGNSDKMVVANSGNIGIGTTTPSHQLTVASSTGPQLTLTDGIAGSLPFSFRQIGSALYIATSSQTSFATSSNSLITLNGISGVVTFTNKLAFSAAAVIAGMPSPVGSIGGDLTVVAGSQTAAGAQGGGTLYLSGGIANTGGAGNGGGNVEIIGGYNLNSGIPHSGVVKFSTANVERARIAVSGNFGIGTTTPSHQLTVASSTGPQLTLTDGIAGSSPFSFRQYGNLLYIGTSSQTSFATSTSPNLILNGVNGNVGIGTTNPNPSGGNGTYLSIYSASSRGNLDLLTGAADADGNLTGLISFGGTANTSQISVAQIQGFTSGATAANRGGYLSFLTKPNNSATIPERMRIDNTGNVGIGTTTPTAKLYVEADTNQVVNLHLNSTQAAGGTLARFSANMTNVGSISVTNAATSFNTTSDGRLKENIVDSTMGLDTLMDLKVRDYNFISAPGIKMQGFVAQELNEIYPLAVTVGGDDPRTNPWAVDYSKLVPLIVKAVQEIAGIAGDFKNNLIAWFADATNGIATFFAKEVHTEKLCVRKSDGTDVCVTGDELQAFVSGSSGGNGTTASNPDTSNGMATSSIQGIDAASNSSSSATTTDPLAQSTVDPVATEIPPTDTGTNSSSTQTQI